ncbi:uncharacterized protein LOC130310990 isoform X2 [Hyla sarda]|uniref:uncharacterized protein LOC130310990 isoform X2 n=1 Tax=Hyla sarda TaxID=327740 RepID=UPI0024C30BAB|nr:uncharacterized protein LOC130310990 isoform X2 [Hyla sarda]
MMFNLDKFSCITVAHPSSGGGLFTAVDVPAQLGSDLHLNVSCQFNGSYQFDVSKANVNIGTYYGELKPRNGHYGRLIYNHDTCILTLKNLTAQDGTKFTVTLWKDVNSTLTSHHIQYRIIISDPVTFPPFNENKSQPPAEHRIHNTSQNSTEDTRGFAAFCLSLDPLVNALFLIGLRIIHKNCNTLEKDVRDLTGHFSSWITLFCQVVPICILSIENPYCLILFLVPILLLVDLLRFLDLLPKRLLDALRFNDDTCVKIARYLWRFLILLLQILFPIIVGILYSKFGSFKPEFKIGFIVLSIIIYIALKGFVVFIIFFCCKTKTTFSSVFTEEPNTNPEGTGEVRV